MNVDSPGEVTLGNDRGTQADGGEPVVELVNPRDRGGNVFEGSRGGMFVDPAQTPLTLMEPSMVPGQSDAPEAPAATSNSPASQPGTEGQ
jgi:hypothetical protein